MRDRDVDPKALRDKLSAIPDFKGDFSVAYSGGLDSTIVPYIMGQKTKGNIHLITLIHKYGSLFNSFALKHVRDLRRIFGPSRIKHHFADVTPYFRRITLKNFCRDRKKYGSINMWCLGCHLSLMTHMIIYNLKNQIPHIMFCSSLGGKYAVMSMPITHQKWTRIYREFGIAFHAPLLKYKIAKAEERYLMDQAGMWPGLRLRRGVHGVQPICIPGLQHSLDIFLDVHLAYDPVSVGAYISEREQLMMEIIEEELSRQGMNMGELKKRLQEWHIQNENSKASEIRPA